jgi:hypothetical protein
MAATGLVSGVTSLAGGPRDGVPSPATESASRVETWTERQTRWALRRSIEIPILTWEVRDERGLIITIQADTELEVEARVEEKLDGVSPTAVSNARLLRWLRGYQAQQKQYTMVCLEPDWRLDR